MYLRLILCTFPYFDFYVVCLCRVAWRRRRCPLYLDWQRGVAYRLSGIFQLIYSWKKYPAGITPSSPAYNKVEFPIANRFILWYNREQRRAGEPRPTHPKCVLRFRRSLLRSGASTIFWSQLLYDVLVDKHDNGAYCGNEAQAYPGPLLRFFHCAVTPSQAYWYSALSHWPYTHYP